MIESLATRKTIFKALFEQITLNGSIVAVYDAYAIPDGVSYPYILIGSQNASQRSTKGRRPLDSTVQIDAVTGFIGPNGREESEILMQLVDEIINPDDRTNLDSSEFGYIIGDIRAEGFRDITSKNEIYYVYRKIVLYSLIITKI